MGRMLTEKALPRPPQSVPRPTAPKPVLPPHVAPDPQQANPARRVAFYAGLVFLFIRLGVVPEVLFTLTGKNTPILYIFGGPAILGAVFIGGLQRTLKHRASLLWLLFFGWMILAVPFSSWKGGSWDRISYYSRFELPLLLVVGGLAANWKEVRAVFFTIACAAVFNLATASLFGGLSNGRLNLAEMSGTLGNPNDLASQLLLVLPFLLFVILDRQNIVLRVFLCGAIAYGFFLIFSTGSRGGLAALVFAYLVFLYCSNAARRAAGLAVGAVALLTVPLFLPALTRNRLATVVGENNEEADESSISRTYLFQQSVRYTLQHPLFGVGPEQFSNFEGLESRSKGFHGAWHATHCAYTQVSSECGVPALLFFTGGIASAVLLIVRLYRNAKRKGCRDIANACFCYLLAMAGYLAALAFLSNAYTFHLPAMIGLAISIGFAGTREVARRSTQQTKAAATAF